MRFDCDWFSLRILLFASTFVLAVASAQAAPNKVDLDDLAQHAAATFRRHVIRQ